MTTHVTKTWFEDGKLITQFFEEKDIYKREWVGLMRGVRVEGDTVVISVHYGNDAARQVCGALIEEMNNA